MWLSQELLAPNKSQAPKEAGDAPCEYIGEEIQRLSVLQSLPELLQGNETLCMQKVVPKVQLALPNASTEFHMAASSTFKTILEKKLVHPRTFTQTFLQSILSSIDSRDPVVAGAWVETLLDVIDLLPPDVVKTDILPIAVNKGQISQKIYSRIMACKLLGKISTRVDQLTLKKETLPIVLSLCQDVKAEVRACICSQLPFMAQGLGAEGVKPSILPIMVELASDEEPSVRLAAVEAIVCMLPYLTQETLKNTIVPLVKKTCEASMHYEDNVMVVLAQVFGELCLGLEATLSTTEKKWLVSYYQQLSELGLRNSDFALGNRNMPDLINSSSNADKFVECRHHCAFHFPAMAKFGTNIGDGFEELLYPVFCGLASDPYFEVRRTIACGFHEVAKVLGNSNGLVKADLVKLLRDDSEPVLEGLIPNLSKTLILLSKSNAINPDYVDNSVLEVGRALLKCESEVSVTHNWRLHELLIQQFESLHLVLPSDFIHTHFTPMLFSRIHRVRQVPVRLAATKTLLVMLRYNVKTLQKTDIRSRIVSELCNGRSCYSRMTFMRLCNQALELFSRKYFKEHFYLSLLERAEDKVPNIRLMFVFLLPKLKSCLRMPSDKKYFTALETSIRTLLTQEKDKDVLMALERSLTCLDRIECLADSARITLQSSKEDQEDQRKLEEESKLANTTGKSDAKGTPSHAAGGTTNPLTQTTARSGPAAAKTQGVRGTNPTSSATTIPSVSEVRKTALTDRSQSAMLPTISNRGTPHSGRGAPVIQSAPNSRAAVNPSRTGPDSRRNSSNSLLFQNPGQKDSLKSLEEEFYRDAGVKIPQSFAAPSRIPNLREGPAYRLRNASAYRDAENRDAEEAETKRGEGDAGDSGLSKATQARALAIRKNATATNAQRHEAAKGSVVDANRRHGYVGTERAAKPDGNKEDDADVASHVQVSLAVGPNRRHSYIERLQISIRDAKGDNPPSSTAQVKRMSLLGKEQQSYRSVGSLNAKVTIPLRKGSNREGSEGKTDVENRRRSLNFGQGERSDSSVIRGLNRGEGSGGSKMDTENKRRSLNFGQGERLDSSAIRGLNRGEQSGGSKANVENKRRSLNFGQGDRSLGGFSGARIEDGPVKRRSLVAPGLVSKLATNQRHSSLERADVEKDATRFGNRSPRSPRISKEDLRHNFSSDESLFSSKLRRPGSVYKGDDDVDLDFARRDRVSKIPRSNNSSPGNSRSSSPSGLGGGMAGRGRHLTAPNSRAASPTAATKRLSLGTLNSYMTSMKLTEAASRLPVRKK